MAFNVCTTGFLYSFFLIFYLNNVKSLEYCEETLYIIRSAHTTALVLDGTDPVNVKIQPFTGFSTQLWKVQSSDTPTLFSIVNKYHGKALDFVQRPKESYPSLVMNEWGGNMEQQWYFTVEGQIVSAANGKNIDIYNSNYTSGGRLILWKQNGCACQEFVFVKKV